MRYMLDTNICIYLIKRQPVQVVARLEALNLGEAVISVVTYAELRAGLEMQTANRVRDEQVLALLVSRIPVLPFDSVAAVHYGILRAAVRERKRDALDRLIAAHAVSEGATLVTNNESDFKDYPGLVVENWVNSSPNP
jgi:tRNA(fMet)-specific endonuclease VapC